MPKKDHESNIRILSIINSYESKRNKNNIQKHSAIKRSIINICFCMGLFLSFSYEDALDSLIKKFVINKGVEIVKIKTIM